MRQAAPALKGHESKISSNPGLLRSQAWIHCQIASLEQVPAISENFLPLPHLLRLVTPCTLCYSSSPFGQHLLSRRVQRPPGIRALAAE